MKKVLAVFAIMLVYVLYANFTLNLKVKDLQEKLDWYAEQSDEFHTNLYAGTLGSVNDGAHELYVSDIYYRKYFSSEKDK